jgi:peroxiredoxin
MKPKHARIEIPAVILILATGLALAGYFLFQARQQAEAQRLGLSDPEAKKHLVTEPMTKKANELETRPAPEFELNDSNGKLQRLGDLRAEKPVVLYFIKDGCPCSQTYEPFMQEFASNYMDVAHFIGVIDGTQETAKAWSSRFVNPYPIAFDPTSRTMTRWQATNSAFTALIDKQGNVVAYWPGYSRWMLEELSQKLADLAGVPRRRLAVVDAPSQLYTGCSFGEEDPSEIVRGR